MQHVRLRAAGRGDTTGVLLELDRGRAYARLRTTEDLLLAECRVVHHVLTPGRTSDGDIRLFTMYSSLS